MVRERGIERVVIDSLNDLEVSAPDAGLFRDYLYALLQSLSSHGVTVLMTHEVTDLFATSFLSEFGVSHMSDNLILLHYLRQESEVRWAIAVLKTRASEHLPASGNSG